MAVWSVILLAYGCSFLSVDHAGFWINDNAVKFIQMRAILDSNFTEYSIPYHGREVDPELAFVPLQPPFGHVIDGKLYAQYSPVFPALSALPYRWLGMAGLYIIPMACGLLTILGAGRIARRVAPDARASSYAEPIAWLITALATPIWFYSLTFWEHTPATALTTWSVAALLDHLRRPRLGSAMRTALLCAGSVYFRDDLYAFGAAVFLLLGMDAWRARWMTQRGLAVDAGAPRGAANGADASRGSALLPGAPTGSRGATTLLFGGVFAAACVPLWLFQGWALGSPWGLHFRAAGPLSEGWTHYLADRWTVIYQLFLRIDPRQAMSLTLALPCLSLWCLRPRVSSRRFALAAAGTAALGCLQAWVRRAGANIDAHPLVRLMSSNAVFSCSPVLLLALLRERMPLEEPRGTERRAADTVLWLTLLIAVVYAAVAPTLNTEGIHWGCRFVLHIYPLWAALAATTIVALTARMRRFSPDAAENMDRRNNAAMSGTQGLVPLSLAAVALASVALQVYALGLLRDRTQFSAEVNRMVSVRQEHTIICTSWFIPQETFAVLLDRETFLVDGRQSGERLARDLMRIGRTRVLLMSQADPTQRPPEGATRLCDGRLGLICMELISMERR